MSLAHAYVGKQTFVSTPPKFSALMNACSVSQRVQSLSYNEMQGNTLEAHGVPLK